jgi:hypothetical protein
MSWLSEEEFKARYVTESATEISTTQINDCLEEGIDLIGSMCGEAVLSEINSASDNSVRKISKFRRAQGKLAYRALLLLMSSRFRNGGILESERDQTSSATDKFVSFSDIEKRREALNQEAAKLLENYLIVDISGDDYGSSIEYSHPEQDDCSYESGSYH